MDKNLLIIFAKNPILGKTKTRLAASIGEKKALVIYKKLIEKTANIIGELSIEKELYYSDFIEKNDNFSLLSAGEVWEEKFGADAPKPWSADGCSLTLTPSSTNTDGFFFAVMERKK